MKILLKIAYIGTAYCGYQVQPNGVSIQQKLNEAAKALFGFPCDIVGCSRTDSGVHAKEFCATVHLRIRDFNSSFTHSACNVCAPATGYLCICR